MRVVLCGGGTGGHVYPLLAVRSALLPVSAVADGGSVADGGKLEFLFIGGSGIERDLVERESVPYQAISGGGLHGVGLSHAIPNLLRLLAGFLQAWRILKTFQPAVILATGGFITVPAALAASAQSIPLAVYLPDIEPALSVRFLGWLARRVTATTESSAPYFDQRKFIVTGYPVRSELLKSVGKRAAARAAFDVQANQKVVLVFGGSRGARSINRAVIANLERRLRQTDLIHISGVSEWEEVRTARDALSEDLRAHYHAFPYLHEQMGDALAAADLVVSRAGASTLGEFPLFGLPSILVPYPYAWRYQKVNADYLANQGAAIVVRDEHVLNELAPAVERLLSDESALSAMSASARRLARPDAAEAIARVVIEQANLNHKT